MLNISKKLRHQQKGAGLVEYGLVVGLIAVLSIGAVYQNGETVARIFCTAANSVGENTAEALGRDFTPLEGCALLAVSGDNTGATPEAPSGPGSNTTGQEPFSPTGEVGFHTTRNTYTNVSAIDLHAENVSGTGDIIFEKSIDGVWIPVHTIAGASFADGSKYTLDLNLASGLRHGIYGLFRAHVPAVGEEVWFWNLEPGIITAAVKAANSQTLYQTPFQGPNRFMNFGNKILIAQRDDAESQRWGTHIDRIYAYDTTTGESEIFLDDATDGVDYTGNASAASDTYIMKEAQSGQIKVWDTQGNLVYQTQIATQPLRAAVINGDDLYVSYTSAGGSAASQQRLIKIDILTGAQTPLYAQASPFNNLLISGGILYANSNNSFRGIDLTTDAELFNVPVLYNVIWGNEEYIVGYNHNQTRYEFITGGASTPFNTVSLGSINGNFPAPWGAGVASDTFYISDNFYQNDNAVLGVDMNTGSVTTYDFKMPDEPGVVAGIHYLIHVDGNDDVWAVAGFYAGGDPMLYSNDRDATYYMGKVTPR